MALLPKLRIPAPEIERRILRALSEERASESAQPRPVLRLSSIGDCPRNLWGGTHGIPEESETAPRVLAIFEHGHVVEDLVIRLLRRAGYIVAREQERIAAYDGRVAGHIDGTIVLGGRTKALAREALLEIKSAKASKFEEVSAAGYEAWNARYAAQVQAYMGFLGLAEALVVVFCKDDSRLYAERIKADPERFAEIHERIETVLSADTLPPRRPAAATSQFCGFCKWCPRNEWCWSPATDVQFGDAWEVAS